MDRLDGDAGQRVPNTRSWHGVAAGDTADSNMMSGRGTAENELLPPVALQRRRRTVRSAGRGPDHIGLLRRAMPSVTSTHYRISARHAAGRVHLRTAVGRGDGATTYTILDDQNSSGRNAPQLGTTYYYIGQELERLLRPDVVAFEFESSVLAESTPTAPDIASVQRHPERRRSQHHGRLRALGARRQCATIR